jgi:hypothetical protein
LTDNIRCHTVFSLHRRLLSLMNSTA